MTLKEKIVINILLSLAEFIGKDIDGWYSHKYLDPIRELLKEVNYDNRN